MDVGGREQGRDSGRQRHLGRLARDRHPVLRGAHRFPRQHGVLRGGRRERGGSPERGDARECARGTSAAGRRTSRPSRPAVSAPGPNSDSSADQSFRSRSTRLGQLPGLAVRTARRLPDPERPGRRAAARRDHRDRRGRPRREDRRSGDRPTRSTSSARCPRPGRRSPSCSSSTRARSPSTSRCRAILPGFRVADPRCQRQGHAAPPAEPHERDRGDSTAIPARATTCTSGWSPTSPTRRRCSPSATPTATAPPWATRSSPGSWRSSTAGRGTRS